MPLSKEQFSALRSQGLSVDQIVRFESGVKPKADASKRPFNPLNPQSQQNLEKITQGSSQNTGLNFVKALPGAFANTAIGAPAKLLTSGAEGVVSTVKTGENYSGKTYKLPLLSPFKSFQSEAVDRANKGQKPLLNIGQGAAETALAGLDTLATLTGAKGLLKTGQKAASSLATKVTERNVAKSFEGALEVVKPKLSAVEEAAAKTQGRGTTKGFFQKKVEIVPSATEREMAQVASEAGVSSSNTFDKNIDLMKTYQKTSAEKVRTGLRESNAIWNKNELKGVLNAVEEPISLTQPDLPIAQKLKQGILKLVDDANKKPEGILDVRQKFDDLVEQNFGKKAFAKDDPKGILIRNYRRALNDFAQSKLTDGKLPGGSTLKAELRKQSLLYDAIENVGAKAPKAGESARPLLGKAMNFIKKHPYISAATAYGARKLGKDLGVPLP